MSKQKPMWCVRSRDVDGKEVWCATWRTMKPDPDALSDRTACGHWVTMRYDSADRFPTCEECIPIVARRKGRRACRSKRLSQQRRLRTSVGLAIVTCILSLCLAVIADAQPAPPAVRLRDVQTMTIAGDIYRSPTYAFVALRAPATPAYHVVQGFAPNVERTYWDGPDIRRHPRTGEFSETVIYLPVWSLSGGKLYVRGMRCLFPADCTPIRLDSLPLEVEP